MKNVILITIDTLRRDVLGCYGNGKDLCPTLDRIAADSVVFDRHQAVGPYTQASFPGILTSSYFLEYGKPKGLAANRTLLSEPIQQAGLTTAAFHSNPYLCAYLGWNRGWTKFYDSMSDEVEPRIPYVRGRIINRKVIAWLEARHRENRQERFFLWVHYMDVHEPYLPERRFVELVDPSIGIDQDAMYCLFQEKLLVRDTSDPEVVTMLKRLYEVHVREVDLYVEEFWNALNALGYLENTSVVITSDHGDEFGEHGGLSHDSKMYRELIDTPLIIFNAGESGVRSDVVSSVDIPPTVLSLLEIPQPSGFEGQALLPKGEYRSRGAFGEGIDQRSIKGGDLSRDTYFYRKDDYKLIYRAFDNEWELFDLANDPMETNNIAGSAQIAESMKSALRPRVRRWDAKTDTAQ